MSLEGKTILVTGGSRGIGREIVRQLTAARASVAFTYRERKQDAEALVREVSDASPQVSAFRCDSRDLNEVRSTVEDIMNRFGPIAGLVNNAGVTRDRSIVTMTSEDWQEVIETDLTGYFNFCRAVIFSMSKRHSGKIVNIGSVSGIFGNRGQVNYSAAKAGVTGLTKALAKETARLGITVNVVAPGYIDTEILGSLPERVRTKMLDRIPMGRLGTAQEVARLVRYLLSDDASYITGQVFVIDGGLAI